MGDDLGVDCACVHFFTSIGSGLGWGMTWVYIVPVSTSSLVLGLVSDGG